MSELHMIQLALSARQLLGLSRALRLPSHLADMGYLAHCAMREAFAELAPAPFVITRESGDEVWIQGYSYGEWEQLLAYAQGVAPIDAYARCLMEKGASKPLPERFPDGVRLGFELRACPVKRRTHGGRQQEVDAYQAACWSDPLAPAPVREVVYETWLRDRFERLEALELIDAQVSAFALRPLCRRTGKRGQGRRARRLMRPDVVFRGVVEVRDGTQVAALLAHGIGRHKAFGFGMLRVRRL